MRRPDSILYGRGHRHLALPTSSPTYLPLPVGVIGDFSVLVGLEIVLHWRQEEYQGIAMGDAQRQILQMLQDGKVTADQAMELMQALETAEAPGDAKGDSDEVLTGEVIRPTPPPNMDRFRRFWQIPFFIAFAALIISAVGLRSLYQSTEGAITFGFVCVWSIFILMFVLTLLAFFSRQATWVHVRVNERGGKSIAISLPLPLGLASWGLSIARSFVNEEMRQTIDMAADFLDAARQNLNTVASDPLVINVDDDNGDRVQIYIG
jgi:hypothetical protein